MKKTILSLLAAAGITISGYPASEEIPIDSPRGSYEGADNIHWYQQQNLNEETYESSIPRSSEAFVCNPQDTLMSCFGYPISNQLRMYYAQGRAPFKLAVWVDSRQTPGFDYGFRRALREVRRINDTLSRSGVDTQVFVSAIEYKNLSHLSFDAFDIWDYYSSNEASALSFAQQNQADAVMIIRNTQWATSREYCGAATMGVGAYWLPIMVLTCVFEGVESEAANATIAAAHEFGHILGLAHSYDEVSLVPFISHGHGYYDPERNTNTVMSLTNNAPHVPIYSSPLAIWNGRIQGDLDTANAVTALADTATTAALFYELKWGHLAVGRAFSSETPPQLIGAY